MCVGFVGEEVVVFGGRVEAEGSLTIRTVTRCEEGIVAQACRAATASSLAAEVRALEHLWEARAAQAGWGAAVGGVDALVLFEFEEESVEGFEVVGR